MKQMAAPEIQARAILAGDAEARAKLLQSIKDKDDWAFRPVLFALRVLHYQFGAPNKHVAGFIKDAFDQQISDPDLQGGLLALTTLYDCSELARYVVRVFQDHKLAAAAMSSLLDLRFLINTHTDEQEEASDEG
jgi:hypothetical protein